MEKALTAPEIEVQDAFDAVEEFYRRGWTDGLPVVPPTPELVTRFLDDTGLEPDTVLADIHERNRVITAEHVAINAVMAGCRPEYMPVLISAVKAMAAPGYKFNHLASLGSPWPLVIVNGPVARDLGMNDGRYVFGPVCRANSTISRALALVLWNCAEARNDSIQRGQFGNPLRGMNCIAENQEIDWDPLHVQLGFERSDSTVTVISVYPGLTQVYAPNAGSPEGMLASVVDAISTEEFHRGVYVLIIPPHYAKLFVSHGWSKQDVRNYLFDNCKRSVADLKRRGRWGLHAASAGEMTGADLQIEPDDENHYASVFKPCEYDEYLFGPSQLSRISDVYVVVAGGDAGVRLAFLVPYGVSSDPVTQRVDLPR